MERDTGMNIAYVYICTSGEIRPQRDSSAQQ